MMPNMNPRQMKKMMQRMGMKMDEIDAEEVVIKKKDGTNLVITEPQVTKMTVQGQVNFQITGKVSDSSEAETVELDEGDVQLVMDHTSVSKETAMDALKSTQGDPTKAILDLGKEE